MIAVAVTLAGCATGPVDGGELGPVDGGELSRDATEQAAKRLNTKFGRRERAREAAYIAATEIPTESQDDGQVRATPVAWSGRTAGDEKATIDVRFAVTVPPRHSSSFGDGGDSSGSATRCYRYTLQLYRDTAYHEIPCPRVTPPPVPSPSPPLRLPPDAEDRLTVALRTATPQTLAGRVRSAFPHSGIGVDTTTYQGTLVAAVGVGAERDCIVMIRTADGKTKQVGYDRIQLEPGESGCHTSLYTNPPR